jgi:hypothetical protein
MSTDPLSEYKFIPVESLTRREYFVGLTMQAILSNPLTKEFNDDTLKTVLIIADATLKELDND